MSWKVVAAVVPDVLLIIAYVAAAATGAEVLGIPKSSLQNLLQIEFLVIHSFAFVGLVALADTKGLKQKTVQWSVCGLLMALYMMFAFSTGWEGLLTFLGATVATYLGFLLNLKSTGQARQLAGRWGVSFLAFLVGAGVAGMPEDVGSWGGREEAFAFGALYFSILGLCELGGLYRAKLSVPRKWRRHTD